MSQIANLCGNVAAQCNVTYVMNNAASAMRPLPKLPRDFVVLFFFVERSEEQYSWERERERERERSHLS